MAKDNVIVFNGTIEDKMPNTMFKVKLENGHEILATVSGKIKKNRIWVNVGNSVQIEMTPYDLNRGRITFVKRNRPGGANDALPATDGAAGPDPVSGDA
jgi:translation initiation factor IF-1